MSDTTMTVTTLQPEPSGIGYESGNLLCSSQVTRILRFGGDKVLFIRDSGVTTILDLDQIVSIELAP